MVKLGATIFKRTGKRIVLSSEYDIHTDDLDFLMISSVILQGISIPEIYLFILIVQRVGFTFYAYERKSIQTLMILAMNFLAE